MTPEIGRVPFTEAIDFLRAKVPLATNAWTDAWHEMHQVSFVVAGARNMAMLADFHAAVVAAIAEGKTKVEFQREFVSIAKRYGWSYRGSPGWRSRVIFETNLRTSYSAGRWAQIEALREARPFIRYSAVMDGRTRPLHRTWHGTILPVGHPWWNTHFPPNGWSCRCTVVSLAQRDLDRRGWKVTDPPPKFDLVRREVAGRGTVEVPAGIDPGFGYNPGGGALARQAEARTRDQAARAPAEIAEAAALQLQVPPQADLPALPATIEPKAAIQASGGLADMPPPRPLDASRVLPAGLTEEEYATRFLAEFGASMAQPAFFIDVLGQRLAIGAQAVTSSATGKLKIAKHQDGPRILMVADTIKEPDEIWERDEVLPDGRRRLVRRYLARWQDDDRVRGGLSMAEFNADDWTVQTAFEPKPAGISGEAAERYIGDQRSGRLVYRRDGSRTLTEERLARRLERLAMRRRGPEDQGT